MLLRQLVTTRTPLTMILIRLMVGSTFLSEGNVLVESPPPLLSADASPELWIRVREWIERQPPEAIAAAALGMAERPDSTPDLATIHVPTLVLHRVGDRSVPIENGRYLAEHIPGAALTELPGDEHGWSAQPDVREAIGGFIGQLRREEAEIQRVLASVLFTDIVGSTDRATKLGDHEWRMLAERHHEITRGLLARYRGREMDTAGDGFFAAFDGPARAIRCAAR